MVFEKDEDQIQWSMASSITILILVGKEKREEMMEKITLKICFKNALQKDNKFVMEYCTDTRITVKEYILN